ncbi:JAB N-terminal domain-containing protein [Paractinoplanes globisporus]|uniref:JAB N-terminal domain-containing protein n=1 Tax=Paractinoplanes globisporus TaxID=113565 RepID=A0ABW6WBT7_9ACTN|nr:JAB N-terminal domain-containing protein [Actinoplanes globisporus]
MTSATVVLFRTDTLTKFGSVGLTELLTPVFEDLLDRSLEGAEFHMTLLPIRDGATLRGDPTLINLRSSHGYVHIRIRQHDAVIYQHPHSVREVIGRPLQRLLGKDFPEEHQMGFGIVADGLAGLSVTRPTPVNEGSIDILARQRQPVFHLEEVAEPGPPEMTAEGLGVPDTDANGPVGVVLTAGVRDQLLRDMELSNKVEEGGFLAGRPYRDAAHPDRHLVLITAVLPAERTGASLLHFTFTGDSFLRISETLARRGQDEALVGWYHTHLFPATVEMGLSTIDIELHSSTFRRPWQVAGLINLDGYGRVLRFYADQAGTIRPTPFQAQDS